MASTGSIAAAIEAIPVKKEALMKAFDDVQAHPSSLAPFSLQWEDLDDHLSFLQRSVEGRFRDLESREKERLALAAAALSSPPETMAKEGSPAAPSGHPDRCFLKVESSEKKGSPAAAAAAAAASAPDRGLLADESKENKRSPATAVPLECRSHGLESKDKKDSPAAAAASRPVFVPSQSPEKDACDASEEEEEEPEEEEEEEEEEPEEEPEEEEEEPEEEPEEEEEEPEEEEPEKESEAEVRPDLKYFCVRMDGRGLRAFIAEKHEDFANIEEELDCAIRAASHPARLVLDAMHGFYPAKPVGLVRDTAILKNRKACILLLERLHAISPEIKPAIRERAKQLATEWKQKIPPEGGQERALPFLQLLLSYGIVSEFEVDDILEVLVSVVSWKHAVDLCRNLGLSEKMPDFVQKLFVKRKKLEAMKFVYGFELVDKFPPVQLLKSYLRDCKQIVVQVQRKGKYSIVSQIAATTREIAAHRAVIKAIAEYNLESEYSPVILQRRLTELEHFKQQMVEQRKAEAEENAALVGSEKWAEQEANKRPRPSTMAATTAAAAHPVAPLPQTQQAQPALAALPQAKPVVAAHPLAPRPPTQPRPRVPLTDGAPYMASNWTYGLSGSSYLYDHTAAAAYASNPVDFGGVRSSSGSSLHSEPPVASGLYGKLGGCWSYSLSGGYRQQ